MTAFSLVSGAKIALATIREHKMRAFLTVLGVIIGTGTVIAVGSILAGLDSAMTGMFRSFGANTIMVFKFKAMSFGNISPEEWKRKPLTLENARAIAERCPSVDHVSPYLIPGFWGINKARHKNNDLYQIELGGTEEGYVGGGVVMTEGRFFTDTESRRRLPVVVIGADVKTALFPNGNAVGKWMEVNGHQFEVVGAMERPAAAMPGMQDLRVLLPYFTMRKMFPNAREHMLIVIAGPERLAAAQDEVRAVLRIERRIPHNKPDNFWMSTAEQMLEEFHRITSMVALVMIVLSSIGLLVGGIGVMNIMLVSVTERTREIGVRKAVGARRSDIVIQFLTEAVVLTGMGGLFGMLLGWIISRLAHLLVPTLPTAVPVWAAVMGVAVSVGVGLFFGIWPASKAARLDPVEALRYE